MKMRTMRSALAAAALVLVGSAASAQQETLVIRGGRVHTMVDENAIDNGIVVIRNGHITAVGGPDTMIPPAPR